MWCFFDSPDPLQENDLGYFFKNDQFGWLYVQNKTSNYKDCLCYQFQDKIKWNKQTTWWSFQLIPNLWIFVWIILDKLT